MYTIGDCYVVMGFTNSAKRNVNYLNIIAYLRGNKYSKNGILNGWYYYVGSGEDKIR